MKNLRTSFLFVLLFFLSQAALFGQTSPKALIDSFTAPVTAKGDLLVISGKLLDTNGNPLKKARIEIWQTDHSGVYDHPGDPGTGRRDRGFQFFGASNADSQGFYSFRTVMPGEYEPRPRHIHAKIFQNGKRVLTTQFYFAEDGNPQGVGGSSANLKLTLQRIKSSRGPSYYYGTFDVVVNKGSGSLRPTDSQQAGPYYPVKNVASYDNDLASNK